MFSLPSSATEPGYDFVLVPHLTIYFNMGELDTAYICRLSRMSFQKIWMSSFGQLKMILEHNVHPSLNRDTDILPSHISCKMQGDLLTVSIN